jgi:hypothetical protein
MGFRTLASAAVTIVTVWPLFPIFACRFASVLPKRPGQGFRLAPEENFRPPRATNVHHSNNHYHQEHHHDILPTTSTFGTLQPPPFHRSLAAVVVIRSRNTLAMTTSTGVGRELRYNRNSAKSAIRSSFSVEENNDLRRRREQQ